MKKYFKCEICGKRLKTELEGGYPNTCAECVPLDSEKTHTLGHKWYELKQLPNEYVIPPKMAQNGAVLSNKELIFKIKQYISQIAKLTLAPAGDFTLHLSLEKLNNFFEELEGEVNE
ncbi:MAG: hypothetical protein IKI95_06860 [Clostridia bacterium]|nr:hypothetical protein [Clostridia bacterium]